MQALQPEHRSPESVKKGHLLRPLAMRRLRQRLRSAARSTAVVGPDNPDAQWPKAFVSYVDWPPDHPPFVSHDTWQLPSAPRPHSPGGTLLTPRHADTLGTEVDPGFQFMVMGASDVYESEDLAGLIAAAGRSKGLVDTPTGSLRVAAAGVPAQLW